MIIHQRRPTPSIRAAGELPESQILWRNTLISWCAWGMLAAATLPSPRDSYGSFAHRFSARHFGADSDITEFVLAISQFSGMLLYGFITACVIGGALVGLFMLFTSIVVSLHHSWRFDDAAVSSGHSDPNHL